MSSYMRWKLNGLSRGILLVVPVSPSSNVCPLLQPGSFIKLVLVSCLPTFHPVLQVMVISVCNRYKVRILQGHFDGTLHIRRSKPYNFAVSDRIPLFRDDAVDEHDDDNLDDDMNDNDNTKTDEDTIP